MSHVVSIPPAKTLYDEDFVLWAEEQARLLEERRFRQLDIVNLIDEVRAMAGSQRREIRSRLNVLIAHLLKWRYQPGQRSPSWQNTIRDQRRKLGEVVEDSPSLSRYPAEILPGAYASGRLLAAKETGIDSALFPESSPFSADQILNDDFLPQDSDLDPFVP